MLPFVLLFVAPVVADVLFVPVVVVSGGGSCAYFVCDGPACISACPGTCTDAGLFLDGPRCVDGSVIDIGEAGAVHVSNAPS